MKPIGAGTVCICGSFRFSDQMAALARFLRSQGTRCLEPTPDPDVGVGVHRCFERIEAADAVLVVNPGGYIGASVMLDIGYATAKGRPVYLTCGSDEPAVMCLIAGVVGLPTDAPNQQD